MARSRSRLSTAAAERRLPEGKEPPPREELPQGATRRIDREKVSPLRRPDIAQYVVPFVRLVEEVHDPHLPRLPLRRRSIRRGGGTCTGRGASASLPVPPRGLHHGPESDLLHQSSGIRARAREAEKDGGVAVVVPPSIAGPMPVDGSDTGIVCF